MVIHIVGVHVLVCMNLIMFALYLCDGMLPQDARSALALECVNE